MPLTHITLVVDAAFGSKIVEQAARGPIWVVRSPENQRAMDDLRVTSAFPPDHLTVFNGGEPTPEDVVLSILATVDEHHPNWLELNVIGASPAKAVAAALDEYGEGVIRKTGIGFTFSRSQNSI